MNIQVKYVDLVGYPQILAGNIILQNVPLTNRKGYTTFVDSDDYCKSR